MKTPPKIQNRLPNTRNSAIFSAKRRQGNIKYIGKNGILYMTKLYWLTHIYCRYSCRFCKSNCSKFFSLFSVFNKLYLLHLIFYQQIISFKIYKFGAFILNAPLTNQHCNTNSHQIFYVYVTLTSREVIISVYFPVETFSKK